MGKEVVMVLAVTQLLEQDWGCLQSAGCAVAAFTAQILTVQNTWVMLRGREGGGKGQDYFLFVPALFCCRFCQAVSPPSVSPFRCHWVWVFRCATDFLLRGNHTTKPFSLSC